MAITTLRNKLAVSVGLVSMLAGCGGESAFEATPAAQLVAPIPTTATESSDESFASSAATTATTTTKLLSTKEVLLKTGTEKANRLIQVSGGIGIKIKGTISNATVSNADIVGAKTAIYTDPAAVVRNLTVKDVNLTNVQREGFRIQGNTDGLALQNFAIIMREAPQVAPDLPEGIAIMKGKNISISDGFISGFKMVVIPGTYTNGDGIASEREVDSLTISRVTVADNSDGGFDLKSTNTRLFDTVAERNYRNYRFWGSATTGTITSVDPRSSHVWLGGGAVVVIDKLVVRSTTTAPILHLDGVTSIVINSCDLQVPAGTLFLIGVTKGVTMSFGPGCAL
jgi:hypothetical protein